MDQEEDLSLVSRRRPLKVRACVEIGALETGRAKTENRKGRSGSGSEFQIREVTPTVTFSVYGASLLTSLGALTTGTGFSADCFCSFPFPPAMIITIAMIVSSAENRLCPISHGRYIRILRGCGRSS